jgi:hypothetical protein
LASKKTKTVKAAKNGSKKTKAAKKGISASEQSLNALSVEFHNALLPSWYEIHYQAIPSYLYHYTTGAGLVGIFDTNKIWASNVLYMNDRMEVLLGVRMAHKIIEEKRESSSSQDTKDFLSKMINVLDPSKWLFDFYVACFSEKDDDLGQWRGYGEMGNGYNLGIFANELGRGAGVGLIPNVGLRKVIYDEQQQKDTIATAVDKTCELLEREIGKGQISPMLVDLRLERNLFQLLLEFAVCFKDKAFKDEDEWRLIHKVESVNREARRQRREGGEQNPPDDQDVRNVKFRGVAGRILPYVELDFSSSNQPNPRKLPIEFITHGPALMPELARKSISLLIEKYGYIGMMWAESSKIPFRP